MSILRKAEVHGLLGQFDHSLAFEDDWEFLIIYGPNGVGKTKLLELINGIIRLDFSDVAHIPFSRVRLTFTGTVELTVVRDVDVEQDEVRDLRIEVVAETDSGIMKWASSARPTAASFFRWIESTTTWAQVGPDEWEDQEDGEIIDTAELEARYRADGPQWVSANLEEAPEPIQQFFEGLGSHLIETQRLVIAPTDQRTRYGQRRPRPTVSEYASDMRRRLAHSLAENSRRTQTLDRTFPGRILSSRSHSGVDDDAIRAKYAEQNELRRQLTEIGVIGGEPDLPLPQRALHAWERNVLWTYLSDTDEKLATFQDILDKVTLLRDIINKRFLRKRLQVSTEVGLRIDTVPEGRILDPEGLSSGEQHELILMYDLLFNVEPGTLVLVDEPEISLHVAWQKEFLDDIARIAELAALRFIVATHSPQIINKWWSRTIQLGPGAE